jgi:hypothetical protein
MVVTSSDAQQLPMPRDISHSYKNGTRSADGKPSKKYWQNTANYNIKISVLPPGRLVTGSEEITYFNHSPDTLRNIIIRLILNIHKAGAPRVEGAGPDYITPGIEIDTLKIDHQKVPWDGSIADFTWKSIDLPHILKPDDSITVSFNWHYQISLESGREGMIDSTTYFLAYFYPRIAVYDDYNGWDKMNFTDFHELYNDFNTYDVTVQVPKNFIVWGTGTLQHPEKLLNPQYLRLYQHSFQSDSIIRIADAAELGGGKITAQNSVNEWNFKSSNVSDVSFGLSDHFVWEASSLLIDGKGNKRVSVQTAYNDTAKDFHQMTSFTKHAIDWLSNELPGITYPYEKMTVFQGYAGMEYPMMANVETDDDPVFTRYVAEHEIAHMYLPFYAGINETRYGFMDEGWATLAEIMMTRSNLGIQLADSMIYKFRIRSWAKDNNAILDIPIITPADAMNGRGMRVNQYGKTALGFMAAQNILTDSVFKKCIREFLLRWQSKHPTPWDMFNTFNNVSGQNLNWFWKNWFYSDYYIDLGIRSVTQTKSGYKVIIDNIGGMAAPVDIKVSFTDKNVQIIHLKASSWKKSAQCIINIPGKKKIETVTLVSSLFGDADLSNNVWPLMATLSSEKY